MSRAVAGSGKRKAHERAASRAVTRDTPDERLVIRIGKKVVGVVISMEELRYFEELEDRLDVRDAEKALANPVRVPYTEVR